MENIFVFKYIKLALSVFVIWAYFWMIHPAIIPYMPNFAGYLNVVQEYNLDPTAVYYNEVPITKEAEMNNRDAVRFTAPK